MLNRVPYRFVDINQRFDGKILEHNALKIERVHLAFILGTFIVVTISPGKCCGRLFPFGEAE